MGGGMMGRVVVVVAVMPVVACVMANGGLGAGGEQGSAQQGRDQADFHGEALG